MKKTRLQADIVKRLSADASAFGMLAEKLHLTITGLLSALNRNSQSLTLPHAQIAIREVLNLNPDEEIVEIYTAEPITE